MFNNEIGRFLPFEVVWFWASTKAWRTCHVIPHWLRLLEESKLLILIKPRTMSLEYWEESNGKEGAEKPRHRHGWPHWSFSIFDWNLLCFHLSFFTFIGIDWVVWGPKQGKQFLWFLLRWWHECIFLNYYYCLW